MGRRVIWPSALSAWFARRALLRRCFSTFSFRTASAATSANDVNGAITAYERFLKVAPDDTNAPTVRQTLAQLKASVRSAQG